MERLVFAIIAAVISLCSGGRRTTTDKTIPEMPLPYFRSSGLFDAMSDSKAYLDLLKKNYMRHRPTANALLVHGSKDDKTGGGEDDYITDLERAEFTILVTNAGCQPYDQLVTLPNDRPNIVLYPSCILLKQCGGCCGHSAMECKPTEVNNRTIKVDEYIYDGSRDPPIYKVKEEVVVEHTACDCECKITEQDCNTTIHEFNSDHCTCSCKEKDHACPSNKNWDEDRCSCRCAYIQDCGAGYQYNMTGCRCEERSSDVSAAKLKVKENPTNVDAYCAHYSCPSWYIGVMKSGACKCEFDRTSHEKRRQRTIKYRSSKVY